MHDPAVLVGPGGGDGQRAGVAGEHGARGEALDALGGELDEHLAPQAVGLGDAATSSRGERGSICRRSKRRDLRGSRAAERPSADRPVAAGVTGPSEPVRRRKREASRACESQR